MKLNKKIVITALILAALTTFGIYKYIMSFKDNTDLVEVWVARKEISAGTKIDSSMIETAKIKDTMVLENGVKNKEEIIGKYADVKILKKEQITSDRMLNIDKSGFAFQIPIDKRAITINAEQAAGVANLIKPGDFLDILLFVPDDDKEYPMAMEKIILQKIQVLAVDRTLNTKEEGSSKKSADDEDERKITIAVSAQESEKIALAENIGKVKLTLRNPQDKGIYNSTGMNRDDLIPQKSKRAVKR